MGGSRKRRPEVSQVGNPRACRPRVKTFFHWEAVDLGNCPKSESFQKSLGEGAKGLLGPRKQEASCTGAKWGCTGAKEGLGGVKHSWETFAA